MIKNLPLFIAIRLFRFPSVLAMNLFIFIPLVIATGNITFSLLQTLPFILMIAGEIAMNDCCDIEKDRINKPQRPLVSGLLSKRNVIMLTTIILILALIFGLYVYTSNPIRLGIFIVVALILSFYNIKALAIPLLKTFVTAFATILSLAFICTFFSPNGGFYCFLTAAFFFILGREFMMDIRDIDGDEKEGYRTLAVLYGRSKMSIAAICFISVSNLFFLLSFFVNFQAYKVPLILLIFFGEVFICYRFILSKNSREQNENILLLWIPMILTLFFII